MHKTILNHAAADQRRKKRERRRKKEEKKRKKKEPRRGLAGAHLAGSRRGPTVCVFFFLAVGLAASSLPSLAVALPRAGPMNFGALGETLKLDLIFLFTF
jgi:hypothetical protein